MNPATGRNDSSAAEVWYELHERDPADGPLSPWKKLGVYLERGDVGLADRRIPGRLYRVVLVQAVLAWTEEENDPHVTGAEGGA